MTLNFALNTVFDRAHHVFEQLQSQVNQFFDRQLHPAMHTKNNALPIPLVSRLSAAVIAAAPPAPANMAKAHSPKYAGYRAQHGTGHAGLDTALPSGGWPEAGAIEIMADEFAFSELIIFLPLLQRITCAQQQVAWISPPQMPHLPTLNALGIATNNLQIVMANGYASYWTAAQTLRAGSARVLLYWPDVSVTTTQRNQLIRDAKATGTLLFLMLPTADTTTSNATLRLALNHGLNNVADVNGDQPKNSPLTINTAAEAITAAPAIIFDQPCAKASLHKQKQKNTFPTLNGIGYSAAACARPQNAVGSTTANINSPADLTSQTNLAAAPADAWVTILSTGATSSNCAIPRIALYANLTCGARLNVSPLASSAVQAPSLAHQSEVAPESQLHPQSRPQRQSQPQFTRVQNPLLATSSFTATSASRRPILGHLQAIAGEDMGAILALELEKTRLDALRLPRTISIDMPAGANSRLRLSTPSSRARQLALINLRNGIQGTTGAPIIGQSLVRKQAQSLSRARMTQKTDDAKFWAPNAARPQHLHGSHTQLQLS